MICLRRALVGTVFDVGGLLRFPKLPPPGLFGLFGKRGFNLERRCDHDYRMRNFLGELHGRMGLNRIVGLERHGHIFVNGANHVAFLIVKELRSVFGFVHPDCPNGADVQPVVMNREVENCHVATLPAGTLQRNGPLVLAHAGGNS
jgi:hypothetical protein